MFWAKCGTICPPCRPPGACSLSLCPGRYHVMSCRITNASILELTHIVRAHSELIWFLPSVPFVGGQDATESWAKYGTLQTCLPQQIPLSLFSDAPAPFDPQSQHLPAADASASRHRSCQIYASWSPMPLVLIPPAPNAVIFQHQDPGAEAAPPRRLLRFGQ